MQEFIIITEERKTDLLDLLMKYSKYIHNDCCQLILQKNVSTGNQSCTCQFIPLFACKTTNSLENKQCCINMMSELITYAIMNELQDKIIDRVLHDEYLHYPNEENKKVAYETYKNTNNTQIRGKNPLNKEEWELKIRERIIEYFNTDNIMMIDGFIRFRLKDFTKAVEENLELIFDNLLIEKEYNEFIKLLRYFVEIQEPKIDEVHVIMDNNKKFILMDSGYKKIDNELLEDLAHELSMKDMNCDDLLISSLITIAPNKITIHNFEKINNNELLHTIDNIFTGKVFLSHEKVNPN